MLLNYHMSCSQFVVCWRFGAAGFGWCSFCRLKLSFSLQYIYIYIYVCVYIYINKHLPTYSNADCVL